jgi:hypothetical protein
MDLQLQYDHQVVLEFQAFISSALLYLANTWICAKPGTDCRRYNWTQNATRDKLGKVLTGGLTNQAVSHSRSLQVAMMNLWTSNPASRTAISSSSVPRGVRINDSSLMHQSESAGRQAGNSDGDGGGESGV